MKISKTIWILIIIIISVGLLMSFLIYNQTNNNTASDFKPVFYYNETKKFEESDWQPTYQATEDFNMEL